MVEHINSMLPATKGLAKYIDVDEDNTTNDIVLLMEYINVMNLRKHIEALGCLEIDKVKIVTYQILKALRDLKKVGYYHGRLNLNNIHIDNQSKIKLTDYMYMSVIDREAKFSPDEGSRLDIFCLGIWILKMLGKLNSDQGAENNIDNYVENMEALKRTYRSVSYGL